MIKFGTMLDRLYSYLNLESTKTYVEDNQLDVVLYSYLNLESTKTLLLDCLAFYVLYSYLNLESTKTWASWC